MNDTYWAQERKLDRMPFEQYLEIHAAHSHGLMDILRSPKHYRWNRLHDKDTPALKRGRIIHSAILEPTDFRRRYRVYPDFGDGKGSLTKKWDWEAQQLADCPDALLLKEEMAGVIIRLIDSIEANDEASRLLRSGTPEVVGTCTDPEFGIGVKARFDYLVSDPSQPIIVDLKSTTDALFDRFHRDAWKFMYDLQGAHYVSVAENLLGRRPMMGIIAVEPDGPCELQVYSVDEAMLEFGEFRRRKAMARLLECLQKQEWPGYPKGIQNLTLPSFVWDSPEGKEAMAHG